MFLTNMWCDFSEWSLSCLSLCHKKNFLRMLLKTRHIKILNSDDIDNRMLKWIYLLFFFALAKNGNQHIYAAQICSLNDKGNLAALWWSVACKRKYNHFFHFTGSCFFLQTWSCCLSTSSHKQSPNFSPGCHGNFRAYLGCPTLQLRGVAMAHLPQTGLPYQNSRFFFSNTSPKRRWSVLQVCVDDSDFITRQRNNHNIDMLSRQRTHLFRCSYYASFPTECIFTGFRCTVYLSNIYIFLLIFSKRLANVISMWIYAKRGLSSDCSLRQLCALQRWQTWNRWAVKTTGPLVSLSILAGYWNSNSLQIY